MSAPAMEVEAQAEAMAVDDAPPALNPDTLDYRELQKACVERGLPAKGKTEVLRQQLKDFLSDPKAEEKLQQAKDSQNKSGWVDWKNHVAREILEEDLEPGGWLGLSHPQGPSWIGR